MSTGINLAAVRLKKKKKKKRSAHKLARTQRGNNGQPSGGETRQLHSLESQRTFTHKHAHTHTHICTRIPFIFLLLPHPPLSSVLSDQARWKEASQADVLLLASQRAWETDGGIKREEERGLLPHRMQDWSEMQVWVKSSRLYCTCHHQVLQTRMSISY